MAIYVVIYRVRLALDCMCCFFLIFFFSIFVWSHFKRVCAQQQHERAVQGRAHSPAHCVLPGCRAAACGREHLPGHVQSLCPQGQMCLYSALRSWGMKHPRSWSCAHCCCAKKGDVLDKILKPAAISLSHFILAAGWLAIADHKTRSFGPGVLLVNKSM